MLTLRPVLAPLAALAFGLALAPRPAAQGLPSPLAPTNPAPIVYCPPERLNAGPPAPQHVLNVFLPPGTAPAGGWPVVVATGYGGGASVPPVPSLSSTGASAPLWKLVAAGIAVVHYGTPGLSAQRGLWYPPGHPSGRYESYLPAHDNPEKSAEWALQWVKVQTLYRFDLARIGLRASSGGAVLAIRTAMGPERARASGSAQVRASTRVAAILAIQPPTSAWALEQGPELTIAFPRHLEQAARPGVPSAILEQVAPELQKDYSLMREAFGSAAARANNVHQPICLVYGDPVLRVDGAVASFALDASGFPELHDAVRQPLQHDSWFGYVFWKRLVELSPESAAFHAQNSVFAMRDVYALSPPLAYHTHTYSGTVMGARAEKIGHDWLVARLKGAAGLRSDSPEGADAPAFAAPGAAQAEPADLVLRTFEQGADGEGAETLVVGVRGAAGTPALVAVSRRSPDARAEGAETSAGVLRLDARALLARPRPVRLAPSADGFTDVAFELGAALGPGEVLCVQALFLGPSAGDGSSVPRLRLGAALELAR